MKQNCYRRENIPERSISIVHVAVSFTLQINAASNEGAPGFW
jgi:hypothetical protein